MALIMRIGIVGGGVLGYLLGCLLHRKQHDVTIITASEKNGAGSTSFSAAGMLSPIIELENSSSVIFELGMRSIILWKKILPTLSKPVFSEFSGSLMMAHIHDQPNLMRFIQRLQSKYPEYTMKPLTRAQLNKIEPDLSFESCYLFEEEGQLNPRMLLNALAEELTHPTVSLISNTRVTSLSKNVIHLETEKHVFDWVIDCRGHQAQDAFSNLRSVRGEAILLQAPEVNITRPIRVTHPRYPLYIVPQPNSTYYIGATEIESEDDSPISVRSSLELLSAVYSVHSGFAEARILEMITGLRPTLSSNLPGITYQPGMIAVNGLYRHGFLIAPAIVEEVISLVESRKNALQFPNLISGAYS